MKKFNSIKSILLVDDDEASNFLHSIFINKLEMEIEVNAAINGQEALDFILSKGQGSLALPCMVMLDLRMPIVDGWEFLRMYEEQVSKELKKFNEDEISLRNKIAKFCEELKIKKPF
jgi:CheY-like chemotaxis protein